MRYKKKLADKNSSPSHQQRTISLSDIRIARLTTVSDQQLADVTLQGTASALNNSCTTNDGASTIITIKQESLSSVDNLVGSFVDSTTFLPSPNSQISNAQMAQNALTNDSNGINEVAGTNAHQHTEIIFTEDDSSCDSQKWGKNFVATTAFFHPQTIQQPHVFGELFCSVFFSLFCSVTSIFLLFR